MDKVVLSVHVPDLEYKQLAENLSQPSDQSIFGETNEFASYRPIDITSNDFPFLEAWNAIYDSLIEHCGKNFTNKLKLDDAFIVHYNINHHDSTVGKHVDPCDITVNLCLEKSDDLQGSIVRFYTHNTKPEDIEMTPTIMNNILPHLNRSGCYCIDDNTILPTFEIESKVEYATIHRGTIPHDVTSLIQGTRTNIILTYVINKNIKDEIEEIKDDIKDEIKEIKEDTSKKSPSLMIRLLQFFCLFILFCSIFLIGINKFPKYMHQHLSSNLFIYNNHNNMKENNDHKLPSTLLELPESASNLNVRKLEINGESIPFDDDMGPVIINKDGSIRRITNWKSMTEIEQKYTYQKISKRNQERLKILKEQNQEEKVEEESHQ